MSAHGHVWKSCLPNCIPTHLRCRQTAVQALADGVARRPGPSQVAVQERAGAAGINPDDLLALVTPVPVENVELGFATGRSPDDGTVAILMTALLLMAIFVFGNLVLTDVVEVKSSRVVEVPRAPRTTCPSSSPIYASRDACQAAG
jgi:hypothetical protein